ncbi:MAG: TetR/AcrR family transcriptional regulator [Candidatus Eisenbacteria bacterium]|uniref:TetR/AcrR family transcriptional regulator n=1 Tax=Eiseniibacteriota bacterium TaxID=2212470 RepID=A0A937X7C6_UNCEI|nr:TetR/AcrR family transcriptional regulator [Candidatus Eisenbacteria bacterium]
MTTLGDTSGGPSRREREQAQHRREARQAAERLLAKKSFRDITVQEIAREAEFSVGYLYKLYPGKEDIFAEVIRRRHRQLVELIEAQAGEGGDPLDALARVVRAIFAWMGENLAYTSSSLRDLHLFAQSRPELVDELRRSDRAMHERITRLAARAIDHRQLAAQSPELIARTLRALTWGFIKEGLMDEEYRSDHGAVAEHVLQVLRRAFAPGGDSPDC